MNKVGEGKARQGAKGREGWIGNMSLGSTLVEWYLAAGEAGTTQPGRLP